VHLLGSFDGPDAAAMDVADPYYGDAAEFAAVLDQVERACRGLLDRLVRDGALEPARP
jgi:protein-tyrosine phosphatase